MTNDDRSNEGRTGDGQVPNWGDAPQQPAPQQPAPQHPAPAADEPRYGERIDPAPTSAPQYGSTQYGEQAPQYGQQPPQYGEQAPQYGQQPHAAMPANGGAPAWQSHEEPKAKKKTLGVVAFVLALIALVVGVVGGYLMGAAISNSGALSDIVQGGGSTTVTPEQLQHEVMSDPAVVSQFYAGIAVIGVGTVFGLWAIVQGIVAIVTKRGRGWGVVAVILAVVAAMAAFGTYIGVAAAAAAGAS